MKILIADDDAISRRILVSRLTKWGFEVMEVAEGRRAWEILQEDDPPRMAILDWMMPGMDGIEICRAVRDRDQEPYIYILLLTAKSQKEDLIEALKAGADDFLVKPYDPHELQVRLQVGKRIIDLQEALIRAREELRLLATRDALTGLWNRRTILEILEQELARASRDGYPLGLLIADLDHFKRVNDTLGHLAGDEVLKEAARRMQSALRPYDALGRYGGEEFLIIIPNCTRQSLLKVAERIRLQMVEEEIPTVEGAVSITLSVGGLSSNGTKGTDVNSLIRMADDALYRAKAEGRNRVVLVSE